MNLVKTLNLPDIFAHPDVVKIMRVLNNGGEGNAEAPSALFVGGCVRNLLMGLPIKDIDIATTRTPDSVMDVLSRADIPYQKIGIEHGTVLAILKNFTFEITTLRKDIKTDGRHAQVVFTNDWVEDAYRRDFTINTLLCDLQGRIYDPLGTGLRDIERRNVIFVGPAEDRVREDYLRILRFFRFWGMCGNGDPDSEALAACTNFAPKLDILSAERITQEFLKILSLPRAQSCLDAMWDADVLRDFMSDNRQHLNAFVSLQARYDCVDVLGRLVLLQPQDLNYWNTFLTLSNKNKQAIKTIGGALRVVNACDLVTARKILYLYGRNAAIQGVLLFSVLNNTALTQDVWDVLREGAIPAFPISGQDLLDAGYRAGPEIGDILRSMEQSWIASDFQKAPDIKNPR